MIVTMMRMIEVVTTTLIITIVESEECTVISVTFPIVVIELVVSGSDDGVWCIGWTTGIEGHLI